MAMSQLGLLFVGSLATLATIGMFIDFGDDATRVLVSVVASILWGFFGMSSFKVTQVTNCGVTTQSFPIFVYIGVGFSVLVGVFALFKLMSLIGSEAGATKSEGMLK